MVLEPARGQVTSPLKSRKGDPAATSGATPAAEPTIRGRVRSYCQLPVVGLLLDDVAVIQAADQDRVICWEARVTRLAHVGIHVGTFEKRAIVERDRLAPDRAWSDTVEPCKVSRSAGLERGDGIGLELRDGVG
jgi:hypothetical protein